MSANDIPELPRPAHEDVDSMLSRVFGKEVANYFSGSPLNRVSFLRPEAQFLRTALNHETTRFILFKDLCPLVNSPSSMTYTGLSDVKALITPDFFDQTEEQVNKEFDSRITRPLVVFLGLDERAKDGLTWKETYSGSPTFALDVTPKGTIKEQAASIVTEMEGRGLKFLGDRMILSLPADEAAVYAHARTMLDWNNRNPFCAACGLPTTSVNGGGKRICPTHDAALAGNSGSAERPACETRGKITNLSFPRTDPTVIMAVVSADAQRIMLGRAKRFPQGFYSTLAGFLEPGESVEEAVRREVWEEAGVKIGRVVIHSTQPWPYPANLMIGAIGQCVPGAETVDLGNDPELDDAKWISLEELRECLRTGAGSLGGPPPEGYRPGTIRLPPPTAIANQLLQSVADGFLSGGAKI